MYIQVVGDSPDEGNCNADDLNLKTIVSKIHVIFLNYCCTFE